MLVAVVELAWDSGCSGDGVIGGCGGGDGSAVDNPCDS